MFIIRNGENNNEKIAISIASALAVETNKKETMKDILMRITKKNNNNLANSRESLESGKES